MQGLYKTNNFVQSLFFAHLTLEKLFKAHWIRDNKATHPPRTHNLKYLLDHTNLTLNQGQIELPEKMNDFQIEGRYPDYHFRIYQICTQEFTSQLLAEVNNLKECLHNKL